MTPVTTTSVFAKLGRRVYPGPDGFSANPPPDAASRWARRTVEKIRTAFGSGRLHWPAWLDNYTEDTPEIREEYHRMLKEPVLKASLRANVLSVACQEAQCHPADPEDARERDAAGLFKTSLDRIACDHTAGRMASGLAGTRKLAWNVLTGSQVMGWSLCECVWHDRPERAGPLAGRLTWRDVKAKDARHLTPVVDSYKNLVGLKLNVDAGRTLEGPELRDLIFYAHWGVYESPLGISEFRAAYRAYFVKNVAWQLRQLHLDRYTGPFLKGEYANADQRAALETALDEARASGWCTVPAGVMVEVVDLATRGTTDFESAIRDCDREMLVGMTGAHLQMMEGESGSPRGDTKVHKEGSQLVQWHLAAVMGDVVTAQMAPVWYAVNFPDLPPCTVTWGSVSDEELGASLDMDERLQKIGVRLSRKERQRFYGRAEPVDEADVLQPQQGGQPPAQGDANAAVPFAEPNPARKFCQEGENAGKPGPCPGPDSGGETPAKQPVSQASSGLKGGKASGYLASLGGLVDGLTADTADTLRDEAQQGFEALEARTAERVRHAIFGFEDDLQSQYGDQLLDDVAPRAMDDHRELVRALGADLLSAARGANEAFAELATAYESGADEGEIDELAGRFEEERLAAQEMAAQFAGRLRAQEEETSAAAAEEAGDDPDS
jgi:hypothetical protein